MMPWRSSSSEVCTADWNEEQDAGRTLKEATEVLVKEFPHEQANIRAYYSRWQEMLNGTIEGTVEILQRLRDSKQYKLYALTNWSAETFPIAQERYEMLGWFDGIVVSGTEKNRKPSPDFYHLLLNRYNLPARQALFIDDNLRNIEAAQKVGMQTIHFTSPQQLHLDLVALGVV